jgi:hypothetical protein
MDTFKQNWSQRLQECGTLFMYKQFKTEFRFEPYLDLLPFNFRNALLKLRLSSHKLAIETGRFSKNRVERNELLVFFVKTEILKMNTILLYHVRCTNILENNISKPIL